MPSSSKRKGSTFEREIVNEAIQAGFSAKRAYASNGLSLGFTENVDVVIDDIKIQCKRRKRVSPVYKVEEGCDLQIFREDRGDTYVVMRWKDFLKWKQKLS